MPDRLAFEVPRELAQRVDSALRAVRARPADRTSVDKLAAVVQELTETGLDFYFLLPLRLAGVGRLTRGTAEMGVAAARSGIPRLIRRVLRGIAEDEILAIADFLDEILIRDEEG